MTQIQILLRYKKQMSTVGDLAYMLTTLKNCYCKKDKKTVVLASLACSEIIISARTKQ